MANTVASTLTLEHVDFLERFKSFWAAPMGARVAEIIAPDASIHFTGAGTFSGADDIGHMQAMLDAYPDMKAFNYLHFGAESIGDVLRKT